MMWSRIAHGPLMASAALACALAVSAAASAQQIQVKITNLTKGQPMSPLVVAAHTAKGPRLFTVGKPASDELAQVTEDAVNQPLIDLLEANPEVGDVQEGAGPIPPGGTATIVLDGSGGNIRVSLVTMLVNTNDAFAAVQHASAPTTGSRTVEVDAYDSGSEANNEGCAFIPGPACGGTKGTRATAGAEGFVHVHNGVHGVGDLKPEAHDWRNPVAQVVIRRLRP